MATLIAPLRPVLLAGLLSLSALPAIGETMEDVVRNAEDAKRAWLTAALEEGLVIHEPNLPTAYSGQFKLRIPKSLHRSLAEHSRSEGISMNQYCLYLLAKNDALYGA